MAYEPLDEKIKMVADMIVKARKIVVFTGAGISTESGIPDFRGPDGLWTKVDPDDFTIGNFLRSPEIRKRLWSHLFESGLLSDVKPNKAHYAIADLEKMGKLSCVITQNVDNLHQKAGSNPEKVYELHGNMQWVKCLSCDRRYPLEEIKKKLMEKIAAYECEDCQGILKPDAVFFGETLPEETLTNATHYSSTCELLIVIGSSLVVYPAAYMPAYAKRAGAKLVIINNSPTPYDSTSDVIINDSAGEVMSRIVEKVRKSIMH
ncbi:MAG: NAD-dependent deacylase [Syntrophales bacterium]